MGGRIYSQQNIDGAAYGSVAADITHQIVKQGILLDPVTLNTPAPATAGFSVNFLIQAAYQDSDTNAVVLPYFNSNNPNVPIRRVKQQWSPAAYQTPRAARC